MRPGRPTAALLCVILLLGGAGLQAPAPAAIDPPGLCESAAQQAAAETGVPLNVLQAIALAESGRSYGGARRPWPWTVNFGGPGFWYDSSEEAQLAVVERQSVGTTNFDVGCFQINHRWHGDAFETMAQMFDPTANALYAARFLMELYQETGSWPDAAAAYHSRTPELAEAYRERFLALQDGLGTDSGGLPGATLIRQNQFPLLRAGGRGAIASLVPQQAAGASLFGGSP
jgi:hypothetical protein